jgi:molybdopterin-guanine dinucleotide biosynthesis protein A
MNTPLYGLVLSGGRSRRMQQDKARLEYGGRPQLARAVELLTPLVERCFVSARSDQLHDAQRGAYPCIVDRLPDLGPIGGIDAALHAYPTVAWLVLACDLPFLDAATLQQLIAGRDAARMATAFRSAQDDKPEPLCAIYEPAAAAAIEAWVGADQRCPRALLARSSVALLALRNPRALDNINTADEYREATARLAGPAAQPPQTLRVQYFALLREQAGRSEETLRSAARDARELYAELQTLRPLRLRPEQLRVAVNDEFADWARPLRDGDRVAFLPPVAGG